MYIRIYTCTLYMRIYTLLAVFCVDQQLSKLEKAVTATYNVASSQSPYSTSHVSAHSHTPASPAYSDNFLFQYSPRQPKATTSPLPYSVLHCTPNPTTNPLYPTLPPIAQQGVQQATPYILCRHYHNKGTPSQDIYLSRVRGLGNPPFIPYKEQHGECVRYSTRP